MNRREFLHGTAVSAACMGAPRVLRGATTEVLPATLVLKPEQAQRAIPRDFLGLSFESAQLAEPRFFSASNVDFAGFLKELGPGVLRIGGNTSEYAFWTPNLSASSNSAASGPVNPDPGHKAPPRTQTTPKAIRNLREFLDLVNWKAIYGLNLGLGTPQLAAEEADFVTKTLEDRLICFQIGNEADDFSYAHLRPHGYSYADFAGEWKTFYDAVKSRVPTARFAGPDTGGADWLPQFAREFREDVVFLSSHYYALGPANDPSMNIDRLLRTNAGWEANAEKIHQAMQESGLPYRLTETNSCYGGGKSEVSNTFASALWALELMFQLIDLGGSGINFHGGGYGWYSPIAGTRANGFVARPEYYALRLMSTLAGGKTIASQLDSAEADAQFACYGARDAGGALCVVAINADAAGDVRLTMQANESGERVAVERLISHGLADEQDTTLAGAPVCAQGTWKPERIEHLRVTDGSATCLVPAASAALLRWG